MRTWQENSTREESATDGSSASHPNTTDLTSFGLGQLDGSLAIEIEQHVADCETCCQTLLELNTSDTFVDQLQEAQQMTLLTVDDKRDSDEVQRQLESLLASHPRYMIQELIGRGGMGWVYRVTHRTMMRTMALKVIHPKLVRTPEAVQRFHREILATASLQHVNLVQAYDAEYSPNLCFLVMELVDGETLEQIVQSRGPLPVEDACHFIFQVACGLAYAHEKGFVHRDIKPQNLMVDKLRNVMILDFGLASFAHSSETSCRTPEQADVESVKVLENSLTSAGSVMGTPDFVAPEQVRDARRVDGRSDLYSLGMTFYFLLAGQLPFASGTVTQKLDMQLRSEPASLLSLRKDIPPALIEMINRMIDKDPDNRFQTANDVAKALKTHLGRNSPDNRRSIILWVTSSLTIMICAAVVLMLRPNADGLAQREDNSKQQGQPPETQTATAKLQTPNPEAKTLAFSRSWSIPVDEQNRDFIHSVVVMSPDRNAMISRNFVRVSGEREMEWVRTHLDQVGATLWALGPGVDHPRTMRLGTGQNFGFIPRSQLAFDVTWSDGIHLYDFESHEELSIRIPHELREDTTLGPAVRSDGRILAARSQLDHLQFWNPQTGIALSPEHKQPAIVNNMTFSSDDKWFFSLSDHEVAIWKVEDQQVVPQQIVRNHAGCCAYNSATEQLVTAQVHVQGDTSHVDLIVRSAAASWNGGERIALPAGTQVRQVSWIDDTHLCVLANVAGKSRSESELIIVAPGREQPIVESLSSSFWVADFIVAADRKHILTRTYQSTTCWLLGSPQPIWTKSIIGTKQLHNLAVGAENWVLLHDEGKAAVVYSIEDGRELWRRDLVAYAGGQGRDLWVCDGKSIELWSIQPETLAETPPEIQN